MKLLLKSALFLNMLMPLVCGAVEIYSEFPDIIDPTERYVIYSHGLIVEGNDPTPTSPVFGVYDFPAIKKALFEGGGFNLIAHHRPKNTEILSYVGLLESWVKQLVEAGVEPSRITLVGFSRGSHLTAYASGRLKDYGVNTALLASCINGDVTGEDAPLVLGGHFLNIYETTDVMGSCDKLANRSELHSFREIAITTEKQHGAFFKPLPEWVKPLKEWINKTNR